MFDRIVTQSHWVILELTGVLLSFTGFYWVLLGFTGFCWFLCEIGAALREATVAVDERRSNWPVHCSTSSKSTSGLVGASTWFRP